MVADQGRDAVPGEQPIHGGKLEWRRDASQGGMYRECAAAPEAASY